jgi:hypothetical protein
MRGDAHHSPPFMVKNARSYTSTSPMFLHLAHIGKCKNMRTMALVTSVCHFTRHGVFQEHNPMADKALMYIKDTKGQCLLWLSD